MSLPLPVDGARRAVESVADTLPSEPRPGGGTQLPLHELLILWIIEHPAEPLKNAAPLFRVRPQWIYNLTSSDLFKARLQEVLREKGVGSMVADLHAKIAGLTEHAIDKLGEKLSDSDDPKFIHETAKLLLDRNRGTNVLVDARQTNVVNFQVDARVVAVADARKRMLDQAQAAIESRPEPSAGELLAPQPAYEPEY